MTRIHFEQELNRLQDELIVLGSMVSQALCESVEALKNQDIEKGRELIRRDAELNRRRYEIEAKALTLIATQQPMASDLRLLAAVIEIATELERTGDYAKGIGRIVVKMGKQPLVKPLVDIPKMCQKATEMLQAALDAFVRRDVEAARRIPKEDDEVDALYNRVQQELFEIVRHNPDVADQANYLLWAAHNLERAADRVTNICERVIFTVTGELIEMDMSDDEFLVE